MARPRRNVHPDSNQPEIVADLERLQFLVLNVSRWLPIPDLFVWGECIDGRTFWTAWEVKTEAGKLTKFQQWFIDRWPGAVQEARMTEDILKYYGRAI